MREKVWVWRVGFFFKRAWQACCERNTDTSSHTGRGADSDSNRLARGNISDVARSHAPSLEIATCRGRLAHEARSVAHRPRGARARRGTGRAPVFMSERMQPENSDFRSSFSGCVPFSVLVTFTARGSRDDPVHRKVTLSLTARSNGMR